MAGEAAEVPVSAEEADKSAAGGGVLGEKAGRQRLGWCGLGQDPFEGDAVVDAEQGTEADGETLVAHQSAVVHGDAVVFEPAFDAAATADNAAGIGIGGSIAVVRIEGGREVGETGTEAESDGQRAGVFLGIGDEFLGGRCASEGGGWWARGAEAGATVEFAEDGVAGGGDDPCTEGSGTGDRGPGEGGGNGEGEERGGGGDAGVVAGDGGGLAEGVFDGVFHGGEDEGKTWKSQVFPLFSKVVGIENGEGCGRREGE